VILRKSGGYKEKQLGEIDENPEIMYGIEPKSLEI